MSAVDPLTGDVLASETVDLSGLDTTAPVTVPTLNTNPSSGTYNLTTYTSGTGTGSLYASNVGTSCGTGCYSYPAGTVVQLTATADTGSTFAGWSGACSGTGTCTVTMNQNQTVTADFELASSSGGGLTGTWSGNVTVTGGICVWAGTMTWVLNQSGTTLSGMFTESANLASGDVSDCGPALIGSDSVQGSVVNGTINLTGTQAEAFTATVSGSTITGTGTAASGSLSLSFSYTLTEQ